MNFLQKLCDLCVLCGLFVVNVAASTCSMKKIMNTENSAVKKGPLPLAISVTGHRDLRDQDLDALEAEIRVVFQDITTRYPHTPLLLLSPLAEGADRLAARVGLEFGARLIVPLPLPRDLYEEDFATQASRREFAGLLVQADQWFEMPYVEGNTRESVSAHGEARNHQYALVGAYVARHSQIFFALWDGVETKHGEKMGGTAEVVRFKLEGVPEPYASQDPLDSVSTGPVYHIVTPRQENPTTPYPALSRRELFPQGSDEDSYNRIYQRMEGFNRDAVEHEAMLDEKSAQSLQYLFPAQAKDAPPLAQTLPEEARPTLRSYAIADTLAIYFAQLTSKTLDRVFASVVVAALCFNLFHSLPHPHPAETSAEHAALPALMTEAIAASETETAHDTPAHGAPAHGADAAHGNSAVAGGVAHGGDAAHGEATHEATGGLALVPWFLLAYLGIIGFNVLSHRRAERNDYQNKHQDYRALAEGLRVQIFWRMAGLNDSVAEHYLGKQRGELEWIRNALRVWDISASAESISDIATAGAPANAPQLHDDLAQVRANWVEDQSKYYAHKARHEHEELEADEQRIQRLLALSVAVTIFLALTLTLPILLPIPALIALKHWVEIPLVHGIIMILIIMLAVCAGLLHGYNQQKARSEHAKQFGRMSVLFDTANRRLETLLATGRNEDAQDLIRELGREALLENGDWVLLHRERPLEVPHAA